MQMPVTILNANTKREQGRKAQMGNIAAAKAVADIIRTTLGPRSMLKMLLDPNGSECLIRCCCQGMGCADLQPWARVLDQHLLSRAGGLAVCVCTAAAASGRKKGQANPLHHDSLTLPVPTPSFTGIVLTNDGHAILREIDVTHPAAKVRLACCLCAGSAAGCYLRLVPAHRPPLLRGGSPDQQRAFKTHADPLSLHLTHAPTPPPPSLQSMIQLSRTQDEEVGDGTTSVIILAGELLQVRTQGGRRGSV